MHRSEATRPLWNSAVWLVVQTLAVGRMANKAKAEPLFCLQSGQGQYRCAGEHREKGRYLPHLSARADPGCGANAWSR